MFQHVFFSNIGQICRAGFGLENEIEQRITFGLKERSYKITTLISFCRCVRQYINWHFCELSGKLQYVKQSFNSFHFKGVQPAENILHSTLLLLQEETSRHTDMSSSTFYDLEGFYGSLGNETGCIYERAHKPSVQVKMRNFTKWKMKILNF